MKALTIWQPYIAGVLHGDGWCTGRTLGLRSKDADFAATFAEGVNATCGTGATARLDERGYWLVRLRNRSGRFDRLRRYEPTDNDELGSWLRGLFDSEGNAQLWLNTRNGPHSYHRRVAFYSTEIRTLWRAAEFLDWLEIPNSIRATTNSASHKGRRTVFELRVCRRAGFTAFSTVVGSSIQRKQDRLAAIASSYLPGRP